MERAELKARSFSVAKSRLGNQVNLSTPPPMSSFPVVAEANSKLHADIALIRLLRAGIPTTRISAIFPRGRAPNTVCCWLKDFREVPIGSGPTAATGILGDLLSQGKTEDFTERAEALGLTHEMVSRLLDQIEDQRIVLCVHAHNEAEAAIAWHIFHHVSAETIMCPADHETRERETHQLVPHLAEIAA
jgi:hypothetical protein